MLLCRSIFQLVSPAHVQHLLQPENLQYTLSSSRQNLFTASNLRTSYTVLSLTSPEITHFELEDLSAFESLTFVLAGTTSSNRSASACVLPWPPSRLADLQRTSLDHRYPLPSSFGCKKWERTFKWFNNISILSSTKMQITAYFGKLLLDSSGLWHLQRQLFKMDWN